MNISLCIPADWLLGKKMMEANWAIGSQQLVAIFCFSWEHSKLAPSLIFFFFKFKMNFKSCSRLQNENVSFNTFPSIFNFLESGRQFKHWKFNGIEMWLRNASILLKLLLFLALRDFSRENFSPSSALWEIWSDKFCSYERPMDVFVEKSGRRATLLPSPDFCLVLTKELPLSSVFSPRFHFWKLAIKRNETLGFSLLCGSNSLPIHLSPVHSAKAAVLSSFPYPWKTNHGKMKCGALENSGWVFPLFFFFGNKSWNKEFCELEWGLHGSESSWKNWAWIRPDNCSLHLGQTSAKHEWLEVARLSSSSLEVLTERLDEVWDNLE